MAAKPDGATTPSVFESHSSFSGSPTALLLAGCGVVLVANGDVLVAGGDDESNPFSHLLYIFLDEAA
jgi:hypothetical protein